MAVIDDLRTAEASAAAQIAVIAAELAKPQSMSGAGYAKTKQNLKDATDALATIQTLIQEQGGEAYFLTSRLLTE